MVLLTAALALALLGCLRRPPHPWTTLAFATRLVSLPPLALAVVGLALTGNGAAGPGVLGASAAALGGVALGAWVVRWSATRRRRGSGRTAADGATGADPSSGGRELTVATLNAGLHRADPARLRAWIEARDTDLVALQELGDELVAGLREAPPAGFPHVVLHGRGLDSTALVSRHPIRAWRPLGEPLAHLVCELEVDGRELRVIVVHPYFDVAFLGTRARAAADLPELARLATGERPTLVVGDFNTTDQTPLYDVFARAGLTDAFRAVGRGRGATFPVPLRYLYLPLPPLVRIDQVWCHPALEPEACRVLEDAGSDHLPLWARVRWRDASAAAAGRRGDAAGDEDHPHLRLHG